MLICSKQRRQAQKTSTDQFTI